MKKKKPAWNSKVWQYEAVTPKGQVVARFKDKRSANLTLQRFLPYSYRIRKIKRR